MREVDNPFEPGAGFRPPELVGRDEVLTAISTTLERVRREHPAQSSLLVGLRGVGKTVLLEEVQKSATKQGCHAHLVEADDRTSLQKLLAPPIRSIIHSLNSLKNFK